MPTLTSAAADPTSIVRDALKRITTLATLPEVTSRIISTVENPKSSAKELHKIVSHDPALVTRIVKVVNSAFYGLPGQISSIDRAIVMLGLNTVKNIAVAASLGQLFRGVKLCEGFTAKDLWTHCIAVGVAARDLARQAKLPLVDEAFLAGMIHDIGILVELQTSPEQLRAVCQHVKTTAADFCQAERDTIGADHQNMGQALCEHWKFPTNCQLAAGHHHDPQAVEGSEKALVSLVHIADIVCCQEGHGFNLTALHSPIGAEVMEIVGLTESHLAATRAGLKDLVSATVSVMG